MGTFDCLLQLMFKHFTVREFCQILRYTDIIVM